MPGPSATCLPSATSHAALLICLAHADLDAACALQQRLSELYNAIGVQVRAAKNRASRSSKAAAKHLVKERAVPTAGVTKAATAEGGEEQTVSAKDQSRRRDFSRHEAVSLVHSISLA
eukprot:6199241-Pleurochrysis_carterae.AAC.2